MAIIDGHIRCCRCGETKPTSEFAPSFVKQGSGRCRPCQRDAGYGKAWAATASEEELKRVRAMTSHYYQKNKTKRLAQTRARSLVVKYGITVAQYDALLAAQGGFCACCGTRTPRGHGRMHVDHDHVTGVIRGLTCHSCNRGIGLLGDTLDGVRRAVAYLERSQRALGAAPVSLNILQDKA